MVKLLRQDGIQHHVMLTPLPHELTEDKQAYLFYHREWANTIHTST
jgi:hypothetical protein